MAVEYIKLGHYQRLLTPQLPKERDCATPAKKTTKNLPAIALCDGGPKTPLERENPPILTNLPILRGRSPP